MVNESIGAILFPLESGGFEKICVGRWGVLSHIFVWGGEGGIGEQNGSGNHDIH